MTAHLIEKLSPYLDGELPPSEEALVSAHLRDCPDCAHRLAELAAVDQLARGLAVEAPSGYFEAFPARVRERLPARPAGVRRLPRWALAAAAVLLVAVITPLSLRERSPSPSVAELPRAAEPRPAPTAVPEARDQATRGLGYVAGPEADERDGRERREATGPRSKPAVVSERALARQAPPAPAAPPGAPPVPDAEAQKLSAAAATPAAATAAGKGRGPWFQSQAQSPGAQAPPPPEQTAVEERSLEAKADRAPVAEVAESEVASGKRGSLAGSGRAEGAGAPLINNNKKKEERAGFEELAARRPRNAAEARALREAARRVVAEDPDRADEARVLVIEAGVLAFRLGRDPDDRARVEADARAYLERADAAQAARVRALLSSVPR